MRSHISCDRWTSRSFLVPGSICHRATSNGSRRSGSPGTRPSSTGPPSAKEYACWNVTSPPEYLPARAQVERTSWLIGKQHVRPGDQRPRERNTLLLPTGEFRGAVSAPIDQPDSLQYVGHRTLVCAPTGEPQRQVDVLLHGERRNEIERLEDEPDSVPTEFRESSLAELRQIDGPNPGAPFGRAVQPSRDLQQCALPRPGRAHYGGERAVRQCDRDAAERVHRTGSLAVDLLHRLEPNRVGSGPIGFMLSCSRHDSGPSDGLPVRLRTRGGAAF